MNEVVKEIKGFNGKYIISNTGEVKNVVTNKILTPGTTKFGYKRVNLRTPEGKCKSYFIHRLVAMNFIPNPNNYPEVNHIDCDRTNNNVNNLEWVNREQNIRHSFRTGNKSNKGIKNPNAKLNTADVIAIRAMHNTGRFSNVAISKMFNIGSTSVDNIINGVTWSNN